MNESPTVVHLPELGSARRVMNVQGDLMEVIPLGAGQEVGRSCVLIRFRGRTVMFDCGIHPAYSGMASLPFLDAAGDLSTVDLCLVTHFHLDHSGGLPYLIGRTNFKGRVFMTHPTRPICRLLWQDFARVSKIAVEEQLYNRFDVEKTMQAIECSTFHETVHLPSSGISFTAYRAGHVLGAAMYLVRIDGVCVLYSGDFSCEHDRHLPSAELVPRPVHVLIVESTYGIQNHEPRLEREKRLTSAVHDTVRSGGKCLLPLFALGRAQEILMLLNEYWAAHPELHSVPIFYVTPIANRCLKIFETYTALCSDRVQEEANSSRNPWTFMRHVTNLNDPCGVDWETKIVAGSAPCVVLAAPGMLQSGTSRELFELWCSNPKNSVIMTGYSVAGTLANDLQLDPSSIVLPDGRRLNVRCSSKTISFSAHTDFQSTRDYIAKLGVPHVVLVHGEATLMRRLRDKLATEFPGCTITNPGNAQAVEIAFPPMDLYATAVGDAVGALASVEVDPRAPSRPNTKINGNSSSEDVDMFLIEQGPNGLLGGEEACTKAATRALVTASDLSRHIKDVCPLVVSFAQKIGGLPADISLESLSRVISRVFEETSICHSPYELRVMDGAASVTLEGEGQGRYALVSWRASPVNDLVGDSVVLMLSELACTAPIDA